MPSPTRRRKTRRTKPRRTKPRRTKPRRSKEEATGDAARTPIRTCVGCRRRADPAELVRVRRRPDGSLDLGPGPGRGAWLCGPPATVDCFETAIRRRAFDRALRAPIADDEIEQMRARLGQ